MGKQQLILTLPLPTSVNHIYGRNKFGSIYLKKEGKDYKKINGEYIKQQVINQGWDKLLEGKYCYLEEVVYMNCKGRDSDNLKKLTQDTITESEVVWHDDSYCLPKTLRLYIDNKNPRLEITIIALDNVGIFNSEEEFNEFEEKCKLCKRYLNGRCGILNKVLDNRITDEVILEDNKWICSKICFYKGGM